MMAGSGVSYATKSKNPSGPSIDLKRGSCSARIQVQETSLDPVIGAEVTLNGAKGAKSIVLVTAENGVVIFKGLPNKGAPLEFTIRKNQLTTSLLVNPAEACEGKFDVVMPDKIASPER
jgi:hypothetical protein